MFDTLMHALQNKHAIHQDTGANTHNCKSLPIIQTQR